MNLQSESIKCKSCAEILNKPVFLPCGHSICKRHEIEENLNRKIECIKCNKSFDIPVDGFAPNRDLESLLEREINELDLGDEYNLAFHKLTQFEYLLEHFNRVKNDPETRIHSVLNDLRNKVDLKREELKQNIDKEALKMIEEINEFEIECKSNLESIKVDSDLNKKLELYASYLTSWKPRFNSVKIDINELKSSFDIWTSTMKDLQTEYLTFNDGLFLNRLNDFNSSQLSVPKNFQTLSVEVKELNKLTNIKKCKGKIINKRFNTDGIEYYLEVGIKCGENLNLIQVNLYSDICRITDNYKIDFDLVFLDLLGMGKSNVKSFSYKNPDYDVEGYSYNFAHMIKLKDLMENYNLYNIEKDSCIVQAIIKRIEYF